MVLDIITYALCRKNGGGGGGDNTHFIGTTTTAITDGATTNPITVDGESYTAVKGDIIIYDSTEFIFDGSAWQSFGGTMDTQPTKDSAKAVTSDGVYRYTAGQREYVNNTLKGEIFNSYSGNAKNIASGICSHAEGFKTKASDNYSHAEGFSTTASGESSHAEGFDTEAWGAYSHAEGRATDAHAAYSHVSGWGTRANTAASTVIGTYNVIDGTRSVDPKHLFIVGNGLDDNNRSNILEVSDTYLNLNGVFKQNGQVIDFSTLGDEIVEMSDIEYDALATKDPDKVYFVYETEVDNRTITAYDSNGDFMYTMTMYGCAASGISLDSKTTTPPTITAPDHFGSGAFVFEATFADGNTYYFSSLFTDGRTGYAMSNNAAHISDAHGTNLFFAINGNRFNLMSAPNVSWVSSLHIAGYDESSFELAITPKPNGFKRIYMGDELYTTNEKPNADDIAYDNTNSGLTATTTQDAIDELNTNDVGKKEYVNGVLQGEIFNTYSGALKNEATGTGSHAEGTDTIASGDFSHAEGASSQATGDYSHAEGVNSRATIDGAHAEGGDTRATGRCSHAEGETTQANGDYSHAEGTDTIANGYCSHSGGIDTIANSRASTVIGKFNVADGTGSNDPKHLFIVGNGTTENARSNILEVSDTYLNLNGVFKQNGQEIDFSTLGNDVIELSDVEYNALAIKDPTKVYFVYETEEDKRTIVCMDSNGNWKYSTTIVGTTASDITGNVTAEESTVTTQPTPGFDYWYGNIVFRTETPEKTVYHSMFYFSNDGRCGMRDTASGDGAPDAYFELGTYGSITYHPTPSGSPISGIYVFSSSHRGSGDIIEFNVNPKPNGFKRIYKGDKLYVSMTPSKEFGALAYKDTASGTAVTTVGTLPSLTYDSTTESFTFSAGTLPTTGTVTVS